MQYVRFFEMFTGMKPDSHLYIVVYEPSTMAGWSQVGILLRACHLNPPNVLPGLVELAVYRVNPGVVW